MRKPPVVFALWALWLTFEYWFMGSHSFVRLWDEGDGFIPGRLAQRLDVASGSFGFWAPAWLGGVDRLSQSHNSVLDGVLFLALPGWVAYAIVLTLQRFVAGYGAYRLSRDDLGLGAAPSWYAGFAFSLTAQPGYFQWGFSLMDLLALPGIPAVIWCLSRTMRRGGWRGVAASAALGLAYSLSSQYFIGVFAVGAIAVWMVIASEMRRSTLAVHGAVFVLAWIAGQLPTLWPAVVQASISQRAMTGSLAYPSLAASASELAETLGDLAPSVAVLLIGVGTLRRRSRLLARVGVVALGVLLAYMVYPAIHPFLLVHARALAGFSTERVLVVLPFLMVMGAAITLHRWRECGAASRFFTRVAWVALAALLLPVGRAVLAKPANIAAAINGVTFADLYSHSAVASLGSAGAGEPFRVTTVADHAEHPAFAWAYGLQSADGYLNLYPARYRDYWAEVIRPLASRDVTMFRYLTEWGNRVYLFSPSAGFPSEPVAFGAYFDLELLSLANVRYLISPVALQSPHLRLHTAPDGGQLAWQALDARQKVAALLRGEQRRERPLYVYENTTTLPRYRLLRTVRMFDSDAEVLKALSAASLAELAETGFVVGASIRSPFGRWPPGESSSGSVEVLAEQADSKEFVVRSDRRSVLFVGDNYNPFWTATIDGNAVEVFPLDGAFQGVLVEPGTHHVRLRYAPPYRWAVLWAR